jgi:hypothetical protein
MLIGPNENKLGYGRRDRTWPRLEYVPATQNVNPRGMTVRSIAWLGFINSMLHAVMEPKKSRAEIGQDMVCADEPLLSREDVDTFTKASNVARPNDARTAMNREIKTGISETLSG